MVDMFDVRVFAIGLTVEVGFGTFWNLSAATKVAKRSCLTVFCNLIDTLQRYPQGAVTHVRCSTRATLYSDARNRGHGSARAHNRANRLCGRPMSTKTKETC